MPGTEQASKAVNKRRSLSTQRTLLKSARSHILHLGRKTYLPLFQNLDHTLTIPASHLEDELGHKEDLATPSPKKRMKEKEKANHLNATSSL